MRAFRASSICGKLNKRSPSEIMIIILWWSEDDDVDIDDSNADCTWQNSNDVDTDEVASEDDSQQEKNPFQQLSWLRHLPNFHHGKSYDVNTDVFQFLFLYDPFWIVFHIISFSYVLCYDQLLWLW